MSANRYSVCPRCRELHQEKVTKALADLAQQYGTIEMAAYERNRDLLEKLRVGGVPESLREDWEIRLEGYTLHVNYYCNCERCGFDRSFTKTTDMKGESKE